MEEPAKTHVPTSYGTLLASCGNRRSLRIATAYASEEGITEAVVLSRVAYRLHLSLVRSEVVASSHGPNWQKRPAELPCLEGTGWSIRHDALLNSLRRKDWTDHSKSGPSQAARRELNERLIPQVVEWLATSEAHDLVMVGEAGQLGAVATEARRKAEVLRAAADELTSTAEMAARGDDVPDALRQAVLYGYGLKDTWEPPRRPA